MPHIVIVPGTNRVGSNSLHLARQVQSDYDTLGCSTDLLTLDLETDFIAPTAYKNHTPAITARVERFLKSDGVVFVIPEYNGSYPGVLKLFVDMLPDKVSFNRRPCAFIGIASGQFQALRAVEHFQGVAGYRNAHMFPNRVFVGGVHKVIGPDQKLNDLALVERLQTQAKDFVAFVTALKPR
ncbi:MAG TPA: NADPH-dependent FMN reductase [Planctomycetota bacterium]|jgi:NAD(P)H-dependent FMN reductase|nr:NADPH-dependent FMN reductase [Planctomycetota bacterium]